MQSDSTVEYRDIEGFPAYRVGNDGSVWSKWKRTSLGRGRGSKMSIGEVWHQLTPQKQKKNYLKVCLCRNGTIIQCQIHHLVLSAFIGPCPEGMEGCHFPDPNPANNRLENLRWDSRAGNFADKRIHGTHIQGEQHYQSKLTADNVRQIRILFATGKFTRAELARTFRVSSGAIFYIVIRKNWKHVV